MAGTNATVTAVARRVSTPMSRRRKGVIWLAPSSSCPVMWCGCGVLLGGR
jgi:hypothetical protein